MFIPHPVITLTANPLAEFTLQTAEWVAGKTTRAREQSFQFGGKGLNVAKMAARLGHPTTAIYFSGGHLGAKCHQSIESQAYHGIAVPTEWETRLGLVVHSSEQRETTFLGPDQPVSLNDWEHLLQAVPTEQPAAVLLCGSIPGYTLAHTTALLPYLNRWKAAGHCCFLDTYGPPLTALSKQPVDLIKINRDEWNTLHPEDKGRPAPDFNRIKETPINTWIITNGPETIHAWDRASGIHTFTPPPIKKEVSPTGSGDVFFATLQHALADKKNLSAAIELAADYAARNAGQSTIAEFPLS